MIIWLWIGFIAFITLVLVLDLGVLNRKPRVISTYEALAWTAFWISLAIAFTALVYYLYEHHVFGIGTHTEYTLSGREAALQFLTGYVIEKSLSIDNIFVIAMIFSYFRVPLEYQHRVLFWGIFGAVALRGAMIAAGLALIHYFAWVTYLFGAFLIYSATKMLTQRSDAVAPQDNLGVRLLRRLVPVSTRFDGERFLTRIDGRIAATPLLVALVLIETADVVFAVDSIPAILAITRDPFLVFTSNIFAVLGLRSLYFALASIMQRLRYLKLSLVFLLGFIGVKMLLAHIYPIPVDTSLIVIASILALGVLASLFAKEAEELLSPLAGELERLVLLSYRGARRVVVLVTGTTVILVGIVMVVTPGPAIVVIPLGLAILATEFVWARRLLKRFQREAGNAFNRFRGKKGRTVPPQVDEPPPS